MFSTAKQWPWSLCQGDVDANLDELQNFTGIIYDVTTRKIKIMLEQTRSRGVIKEILMLWLSISWSTLVSEQGHVHTSLARKNHTLRLG